MPTEQRIRASFWFLVQYDVAEEISLESLRTVPPPRIPRFRQPVPQYVGFERPPVMEAIEPVSLSSGETLEGFMQIYGYGVVGVSLVMRFEANWAELVERASQWIPAPEVEALSLRLVKTRVDQIRNSLMKPYTDWLSEDYYIVRIEPDPSACGESLLAEHAGQIAQIVRGERVPLASDEIAEIVQSRVSYYPQDLLVVGWMAAFLCDDDDGAATSMQLLEYANSQLLEFRHYDRVLTQELAAVYEALDEGIGYVSRWKLAGRAERLNTLRLDVMELAERVDNSLKFLSDMFAARMYRLIATKIGVPDYRRLVDAKLNTARELYRFMMDEFHQGRAFVLELMVVIILVIELVFLFRGIS
jgi:hypothetical protein